MGCDMVVALGRATADGSTLFGRNNVRSTPDGSVLRLITGRSFALGEKVRATYLEIPQARQTSTVLGNQPLGDWGYDHGLNEHQVAVGWVDLRPTLTIMESGLAGTDIVRLLLERCQTARQAVDLFGELARRHGLGAFPGCPAHQCHDSGFLIADPREAYAIETAGSHWVHQEIREVRAAGNLRVIRQDWDRISTGFSTLAIEQGWWPEDGSKLDFAGAVAEDAFRQPAAMRRWGRAMLLLQEQNGHIDSCFLRRILRDHDENEPDEPSLDASLCRHGPEVVSQATTTSLIARLFQAGDLPAMAWCAFGPPCTSVYVPVFLLGQLPPALEQAEVDLDGDSLGIAAQRLAMQASHDPEARTEVESTLAALQSQIDQETDEFLAEAAELKRRESMDTLRRETTHFMQHNLERLEEVITESLRSHALAGAAS